LRKEGVERLREESISSVSAVNVSVLKKTSSQPVVEAISAITEELDDHRQAINENTNEIASNYEFLCKLDTKLEALSKRVEELTGLAENKPKQGEEKPPEVIVTPLTNREKEVFRALYRICEETGSYATYKDLAANLRISEQLVSSYIANFIAKGIQIKKRYFGNIVRIGIDAAFRHLQAKRNIVGLNTPLTHWLDV
jgi:uncharacterized membrane protein